MSRDHRDYSELSIPFIRAMVSAMYAFEVTDKTNPNLLSREEENDFYIAYMGTPIHLSTDRTKP